MKRRTRTLAAIKGKYAYIFLLPLLFGIIVLFGIPMLQSLWFSFSKVGIDRNGFFTVFNGFGNYYEALFINLNYRQEVVKSLLNLLLNVPIITVFSFFMANILNQSFPGRSLARVIMFLTLVLSSSALINFDSGDLLQNAMNSATLKSDDTTVTMQSYNLGEFLITSGILPTKVSEYLMSAADRIYSIVIYSGVEIMIFLAALQSVPHDMYEVASIEGATAWETYWKITFPLVTPFLLLCVIYAIIDSFTMTTNTTLKLIQEQAFGKQSFGVAAAMSWIYFIVIIIVIGITFMLLSRMVKHYEN